MTELVPTSPRERLVTLDSLRGLALLGVLLGNIAHLYSGQFARGGPSETLADEISRWFIALVVQSKAQTLLTFLFGFGFAAQLIRARERHRPVCGLYTRRLLVLLGFGILHVLLLAWVDVLWTYAVAGFALLAFMRVSNRARVVVGLILVFVPTAIYWLPGVHQAVYALLFDPAERLIRSRAMVAAMHGTDHFATLEAGWPLPVVWIAGSWPQYFSWLVGHFLLGYVVGSLRWFDRDGADHVPAFRKLLVAGVILGGAGTTLQVLLFGGVVEDHALGVAAKLATGALFEAQMFGLAILFVGAVVLLAQRPWWKRALAIVAPIGRMPLTTYLMQSLICTFVIDGWGLGWIEWLSEAGYVGLGFAVFALQLVFSHAWLRYFRFGPLEWIWRGLVYLRRPPMRV